MQETVGLLTDTDHAILPHQRRAQLLRNLPNEYIIRTIIEDKKPSPSISETIETLMRTEEELNDKNEVTSANSMATSETALYAGSTQRPSCTPPMDHLRRIGCLAYHRIPDDKFLNKTALKFSPRSTRCILIGYTESTKIWKLWDLSKQRALRSTDAIFVESENVMDVTTSDKLEDIPSIFSSNEHRLLSPDEDQPFANEPRTENKLRAANEPRTENELRAANGPRTENELRAANEFRTANEPRDVNELRVANEPRTENELRIANEPKTENELRTANEPRDEKVLRATNESRIRKEEEEDELLRQVDNDLRRLTSSEACLAIHTEIVYYLDGLGSNHDPLTFYEVMESTLRN